VCACCGRQGFAVLVIGLPDRDEASGELGAGILNNWPAADYARFLRAAVDHLDAATAPLGARVDPARVGLLGQ
jgi:hypothetical protein